MILKIERKWLENDIYNVCTVSDYRPDWAASEKYNAFKLLVVKEVVKGPQAAFLTEGVRVKVWVVATNNIMAVI